MAATILLIRHAAHDRVDDTLCGRMEGVALGALGRAQAASLARRLGGLAAVYTSPVLRARQTAQALSPSPDLVHDLQEVDFGEWTGRRFDALDADPRWRDWNERREHASPPGGETMVAAQRRTLAALAAIAARHDGQVVAAVSHGEIIRAALLHALGLPLGAWHRLEVGPASVSRLVLRDGAGVASMSVASMNEGVDA